MVRVLQIDSTTWRSPNHSARRPGTRISAIVVHSCEGRPAGAERTTSLPWLCNPDSQVSCHYYVRRSGVVYQLVDDARRAWHAGEGAIGADRDPNGVSIGIELEHAAGSGAYPIAQLAALRELCRSLMARYGIRPARVVSHRVTALPAGRKEDPTDWPEAEFRRWADSLAVRHGTVLTSAPDVARVQASVQAGGYDTLKVVTAWGLARPWDDITRAQVCNLTPTTVVRTHAGDPSAGKPFPHVEEVLAEVAPWLAVKPNCLVEIGNEPNSSPAVDTYGYRWHLNNTLQQLRDRYPGVQVIAPALVLGPTSRADVWLDTCADVFAQCDLVGVHLYEFYGFSGDRPASTGQFAQAQALYGARFPRQAWALTEYGIHDPATPGSVKGQRYAQFVRALPAPYQLATSYHIDTAAVNDNDRAYHIDLAGDRAYGAAWRA